MFMKRSFYYLMILVFASSINCFSQITTNELPVSVQKKVVTDFSANSLSMVSLPVPDIDTVTKEDQERERNGNKLKRISIGIPVSIRMDEYGLWTTLEDGGKLWQLQISAENAKTLDFVFSKFWLPEGGKFFIFNPLTLETIGGITSEYLLGSKNTPHRFSTAMVKGDNVILEYYQPKEVDELPIIEIAKAYYGYNPIIRTETCIYEVNVNCSEGANWKKEKRAIAGIDIKLQNGYWGTGALLNSTQANHSPLLLTANHCLLGHNDLEPKDALGDSDASDWIFYWNYELSGCAGSSPQFIRTTSGATVIANNSYSDFALLQLQQDPLSLSSYIPYYLGWDRSGNSGTGGVCIHHPLEDYKKISTYNMTPITTQVNSSPFVYWGVSWIATANGHGITESGSSGSPLINSNHKVIGQLCAGASQCSGPYGTDHYGKFNVSWTGNGNSNIHRRLNYWLDPLELNMTMDGTYPFSITGPVVICTSSTYSVNNIKTGCSVVWSFKNASSLNSLIQQNYPSSNKCTITPGSTSIDNTLVATIWYDGTVLCTVEKDIMTPKELTGTVHQEGQYFSGNNYPSFTINLETIFAVNQVCDITLQSPKFKHMNFTTSTNPTTNVVLQRINSETIKFCVAPSTSNVDLRIYGTAHGTCNNFELRVLAMKNPIDPSNPFYINRSGSTIELELIQEMLRNEDGYGIDTNISTQRPWTLEVYEATTVRKVYSEQIEGNSLIIDTSGWNAGVYIICAVINGKTYSTKVTVK